MFGGEVLLSIKSNDLYFYNADGNLWTQKASGPAARYRHSAVLDPAARSLYIFAGTNLASAGNTFNDLHRYDVQLDSWTELTGTVGRSRHTAVWDGTSDRMIVFGGSDNMLNKLGSLAEYDRATDSWSSPAAVGPAARDGHVAVWDPATGSMLMCCGTSGTSLGDLWSYNGAWSQLSPSGSITARRYASAVWDSQAGAMLGFAGSDSGASKLNSLFFYSASTNSWSEYTETGPPAQDRGAAAWDPENARLYAFGGYDWLGLLGSLWRFDASHTSMTSTSSATSATETATTTATTTTTLTTSTVSSSSTQTSSTSSITSSSTASSTSSITATLSTTSTTLTASGTTTTSASSTSTTQSRWVDLRLQGLLLFVFPENPSGVGFSFSAPTRGARYRAVS